MLTNIRNAAKPILDFPPVRRYLRYRSFRTAVALYDGTHTNTNTHPSIIHFSMNKAATQYIKSILERCARKSGMTRVGLAEYAFHSNFPYLHSLSAVEMEDYKHMFRSKGYLYSAFGSMVEGIEQLEDYKIVLVTRDPRDILVSGYYSIKYSHTTPSQDGDKYEPFMEQRRRAQETTIDEYAISESDHVADIFNEYQTALLNRYSNVHLTQYEKMIADFEAWLDDLLEFCELDLDPGLVQQLVRENDAKRPKAEDVTKHMRKGRAGDYKEKLKSETIQLLNEKFAPILELYNYQAS